MSVLAILCIILASLYYRNKNSTVDPRIAKARKLYEKYNGYAVQNQFDSVFMLLDSIEAIYSRFPHYKNSFETGVLYNNRAAAFLIQALHSPVARSDSAVKDSLLNRAGIAAERSIEIYTQWLKSYGKLDETQLKATIRHEFLDGLGSYEDSEKMKFLDTRNDELLLAQRENKRRLSVALTNLGIVHRHQDDIEGAVRYYIRAMELWDRNLDAENNLNLLIGKPLRERTIIEKLFPPEKD